MCKLRICVRRIAQLDERFKLVFLQISWNSPFQFLAVKFEPYTYRNVFSRFVKVEPEKYLLEIQRAFWQFCIDVSRQTPLPPPPHLLPPLISPKAKKILGFFLVKDLFFSIIGKKGKGLTAPPLFSRKMLGRGGGQLGGFAVIGAKYICTNVCICKSPKALTFVFLK